MVDPIDTGDMRKKGIAQTGAFTGTLNQTGDIGQFEDGRNNAGRFVQIRQVLEILIGDDALDDIRVDCTKGIIRRLRVVSSLYVVAKLTYGEVEKSRFSYGLSLKNHKLASRRSTHTHTHR